jgi:serine/threonine protein kinase
MTRTMVRFGLGIASGMKFIHSCGYLHCDLKPTNVLLKFDVSPAFTFQYLPSNSCFPSHHIT